jgi:hypothetical protein
MNCRLILVSMLSASCTLTVASTAWAQALPAVPGGSTIGARARALEPATAPGNQFGDTFAIQSLPEASGAGEIGRLVGELREADESKKAELTKQLETAVAKQFERDMENRETELTKLDERLSKLRAQLDRRRKAKTDIIQLQVKVLVNEADGLGFGAQPLQPSGLPKASTRNGSIYTPSSTPAPAINPAAQHGR